MKRITVFIISLVLMLAPFTVLAAEAPSTPGVAPASQVIAESTLCLTFEDGVAHCEGAIIGEMGTTEIIAFYILYEMDTSDNTLTLIEVFQKQVAFGDVLYFYDTAPAELGKTYYFCVHAQLEKNGVIEEFFDAHAVPYSSEPD